MQNNKQNKRLTQKNALTIAVALLMTALGGFLVITYSNLVVSYDMVTQGNMNVKANDYYIVACPVNKDGAYMVKFDVDHGLIQLYGNSENSTLIHYGNGTDYDIRKTNPMFTDSSAEIAASMGGDTPWTHYFIFSNSDAYSKNITYEINYRSEYFNHIALIAGIYLITIGLTLFILALIKNRAKETIKPMENQQ